MTENRMPRMTMKRLMENYSDEIIRLTNAKFTAAEIAALIRRWPGPK